MKQGAEHDIAWFHPGTPKRIPKMGDVDLQAWSPLKIRYGPMHNSLPEPGKKHHQLQVGPSLAAVCNFCVNAAMADKEEAVKVKLYL